MLNKIIDLVKNDFASILSIVLSVVRDLLQDKNLTYNVKIIWLIIFIIDIVIISLGINILFTNFSKINIYALTPQHTFTIISVILLTHSLYQHFKKMYEVLELGFFSDENTFINKLRSQKKESSFANFFSP